MVLPVVRRSARGKRARSSNQVVEELTEDTPGEEPASTNNLPSLVTNLADINIGTEVTPEEENVKAEVTSASENTEIAETQDEKSIIIKQEYEVAVKESTAAEATTEEGAEIKGILEIHFTSKIFVKLVICSTVFSGLKEHTSASTLERVSYQIS